MIPWSLRRSFLVFATVAAVILQVSVASGEAVAASTATPKPAYADDGISVYFSPVGGCTDAVVQQINQAKQTIEMQAYSFSSAPISKALLDAHKRGVKVAAVLDRSQQTAKYSGATFLANAGIPVVIDDKHAIAHNKIIIIDGKTVITGSFNFTKAAEQSNAENLLVIKDNPDLAAAYIQNFEKHRQHSVEYQGLKGGHAEPAKELAAEEPAEGISETPAVPQADGNVIVHVTKSGKRYHREGCTSLAKSDIPMKLSDAKAAGFTPCLRCRPPE